MIFDLNIKQAVSFEDCSVSTAPLRWIALKMRMLAISFIY